MTAAAGLWPDAAVLFGPRAAQDLPDVVLIVGTSVDEGGAAFEVQREVEGLAGHPHETISVHCELSTWSGDPDDVRTSTLATMLGELDAYLQGDSRLGGACDGAQREGLERWYILQSDDGPGVGVTFDVVAEAYI